jgi:hypothetical protein
MIRTMDATAFNVIAGDPEVRPFLGYVDPLAPIDLSSVTTNIDNFCILTPNADGGYILEKKAPGLYGAHTLALPSARGRPMLKLMREGFSYMFTATDATEIFTIVPDGADAAEKWSIVAGFEPFCRREAWFPFFGERVGTWIKTLDYAKWVLMETANKTLGESFHLNVEERLGGKQHAVDTVHDHWVGATFAGCIAGNPGKAVGLYNRYALMSGYLPATFLRANPITLDIGTAIVTLGNGDLEILTIKR